MPGFFARPILAAADIHRMLDFYVGKLGFHEAWRYEEDGEVLIAQVSREGCDLIFSAQPHLELRPGKIFLSLDPPDLDAFRAEIEARGVATEDGQWGYRLMVVTDPDGNELMFNYPAESDPA